MEPRVIRHGFRRYDHSGSGIDPGQQFRFGQLGGEQSQEESGSTTDIQHTPWIAAGGEGEIGGPGGNVVMHPTVPPIFIGFSPIVESLDISIVRHYSIMPSIRYSPSQPSVTHHRFSGTLSP